MKKIKVAIIRGHSQSSQGAVAFDGTTEFTWNGKVKASMKTMIFDYPWIEFGFFVKKDNETFESFAKRLKSFGAVLAIELHFNSFKSRVVGLEMLLWKDSKNLERNLVIADVITDNLSKAFGIRQRGINRVHGDRVLDGIQKLTQGVRGVIILYTLEKYGEIPHSMIIEPGFLNHDTPEARAILYNIDGYARNLLDSIAYLFPDPNVIDAPVNVPDIDTAPTLPKPTPEPHPIEVEALPPVSSEKTGFWERILNFIKSFWS